MPRIDAFSGPGPPPDPGKEAHQRSPASAGHVTTSSRDNLAVDQSPPARATRSKIPVKSQSRNETSDNRSNSRFGKKSTPRYSSAVELYIGTKIPITLRMSRSGQVTGRTNTIPTPILLETQTEEGSTLPTPYIRLFSHCVQVEQPISPNMHPIEASTVRSSRLPVPTGNKAKVARMCTKKSNTIVPSKSCTTLRRQDKCSKIPVKVKKPSVLLSKIKNACSDKSVKESKTVNAVEVQAVDPNVEVGISSKNEESIEVQAVDSNVEVGRSCKNEESDEEQAVDPNVEVGRSSKNEESDKEQAVDPNVEVGRFSKNEESDEEQAVDPNVEVGRSSKNEVSDEEQAVDPNMEVGRSSKNEESDEEQAVDPNVDVGRSSKDEELDEEQAVDPNMEVGRSSKNGDCEESGKQVDTVVTTEVKPVKPRNFGVHISSRKMAESEIAAHNEEARKNAVNIVKPTKPSCFGVHISSRKMTESEIAAHKEERARKNAVNLKKNEDPDVTVVESKEETVNVTIESLVGISKLNNEATDDVDINQANIDKEREERKCVFQEQILSKEIELRKKLRDLDEILEVMLGKRSEVDRIAEELCEVYQAIEGRNHQEDSSEYREEMETFHSLCIEADYIETVFSYIPQECIVKAMNEHKLANENDTFSVNERNDLLPIIRNADAIKLDETKDKYQRDDDAKEHPGEEINPTYQRDDDAKEQPGGEINTTYQRDDDAKGQPGEEINPTYQRDDDAKDQSGDDTNPTHQRDDNAKEQPGDDTNPTYRRDDNAKEQSGDDTNPTHQRDDNAKEQSGDDTNPAHQRDDNAKEQSGDDTNPTHQRDDNAKEQSDDDTNPTHQRDDNAKEQLGDDTNPTHQRDDNAKEQSGDDTNPTHQRDDNAKELSGDDTNPTHPSDDNAKEQPGDDTNPTHQRDDNAKEQLGDDTNPTYQRDDDAKGQPGEDTNKTRLSDNEHIGTNDIERETNELGHDYKSNDKTPAVFQVIKQEILDVEEEFAKNRKRHEEDISNIKRFWKNAARFSIEEVTEILLEATGTPKDDENTQSYSMDDLMKIVLKAINSNTLEVINEICETNDDKCNENVMSDLMAELKQHKMKILNNIVAVTTSTSSLGIQKDHDNDEAKHFERLEVVAFDRSLEPEFDQCDDGNESCQSERSACSIERRFDQNYEKLTTPEEESIASTRSLSARSRDGLTFETDGKDVTSVCKSADLIMTEMMDLSISDSFDSLVYNSSVSPFSRELGMLSQNSTNTNTVHIHGDENMMCEWHENSDKFMKCEKLVDFSKITVIKHHTVPYDDEHVDNSLEHYMDISDKLVKCENFDDFATITVVEHDSVDALQFEDNLKEQHGFEQNWGITQSEVNSSKIEPLSITNLFDNSRKSAIPPLEHKGEVDDVSKYIHINNDTVDDKLERKIELRPESPLRGPEVRGIFKNKHMAKQRNVEMQNETLKPSRNTERKPYSYGQSKHPTNDFKTEPVVDFAGLRIDGTNINDKKSNKNNTQRPRGGSGIIKMPSTKNGLPRVGLSKKHSPMVETTKREILNVFSAKQQSQQGRRSLYVGSYGTAAQQPSLNPHHVLPSITPANGKHRNTNQTSSFTTNHRQTSNFTSSCRQTPSTNFQATPLPAIKSKHHRQYGK